MSQNSENGYQCLYLISSPVQPNLSLGVSALQTPMHCVAGWGGGARDWTQNLIYARQVLCNWATSPALLTQGLAKSPRLALNLGSYCFSLSSTWDYRCVPNSCAFFKNQIQLIYLFRWYCFIFFCILIDKIDYALDLFLWLITVSF